MKILRLNEVATIPTRKHSTDAGLDLYSLESTRVKPHNEYIFRTGVAVEIPEGYFGLIHAKSKSDFIIGGGIVDQNYRGELLVKICNYGSSPIDIWLGDAIAQLLIIPCITPSVKEVSFIEFNVSTDRGATGGIVSQLKSATFTSKVEPLSFLTFLLFPNSGI